MVAPDQSETARQESRPTEQLATGASIDGTPAEATAITGTFFKDTWIRTGSLESGDVNTPTTTTRESSSAISTTESTTKTTTL